VKKKIIVIGIAVMMIFAIGLMTGCATTPRGYVRRGIETSPILMYFEDSTIPWRNAEFDLKIQFPYINLDYECNNQYFVVQNQLHSIRSTTLPIRSGDVLVYKNCETSLRLGQLVTKTDAQAEGFGISIVFVHSNYIYYQLTEGRSSNQWNISEGRETVFFSKYTFHRFNLNTGENEKIGLNHFYNKLSTYFDDIKLNPNFSVR